MPARPSRIKLETIEREAEVLKLRRGGLTFDLIAKQLGYSHASGAHKAYVNACKRIIVADVEEIRATEIDRLDMAQAAIWSNVLQGDVPSINTLIRIMERRARLLGLDAPAKAQLEVTTYDANVIDAELSRLITILDSGAPRSLGAPTSQTEPDTE